LFSVFGCKNSVLLNAKYRFLHQNEKMAVSEEKVCIWRKKSPPADMQAGFFYCKV
jgi:hypothetical protein